MHRDLKPANILLHNDMIKLADFGFCRFLDSDKDMATTMVGSPIYMAPEVIMGQNYNHMAEIWSLGCVIFELIFGQCPFEEKSIAKLIGRIKNSDIDFPKNVISDTLENLLKSMLVKDVEKRMSWEQLFSHDLLKGDLEYRYFKIINFYF